MLGFTSFRPTNTERFVSSSGAKDYVLVKVIKAILGQLYLGRLRQRKAGKIGLYRCDTYNLSGPLFYFLNELMK